MKFSVFQLSHQGARPSNEDRMGYAYTSAAAIFLLADGMGGHPQGEVAAEIALQTVAALFQAQAQPEITEVKRFLETAVLHAHQRILNFSQDRAEADMPRTTIVIALVQNGAVSWTHCGDSRFYLVRQGQLLARTKDHSMAEHRRQQSAACERASDLGNRNILFTCLGSPSKPVFNVTGPVPLQLGDKLLLCSDGLWASLKESTILLELSQNPVDAALPSLVEQALAHGAASSDNVTCIAMEWQMPEPPKPRESVGTNLPTQEADFDLSLDDDQPSTLLGELDAEPAQPQAAFTNKY